MHCTDCLEFPMQLSAGLSKCPKFQRDHIPISKLIDRTCPTFIPTVMPKLPGAEHTRFVTFPWVTSTPFGVPVVPRRLLADMFFIEIWSIKQTGSVDNIATGILITNTDIRLIINVIPH